MSSRANVSKRGSRWTYYVYVTGGDGRRRQVSKGGFRTRKEAEGARVEALNAVRSGTWVRPERVTVREFIEGEWLPTQLPPTLEESTYRSYARYVRLHVVPYIGGIPLQQLTPMDLNAMYRKLLDEGRQRPTPPVRQHAAEVVELVERLRKKGGTWQAVADGVAETFLDETGITRHAVAALYRRRHQPQPRRVAPAGLKARTVRYVHTIVHAALRDAMRWNRVARNVADAATPPPIGSVRNGRPEAWTSDQLRSFLNFVADSRYLPAWVFLATTGCRRGECLGLQWGDLDLDSATAIIVARNNHLPPGDDDRPRVADQGAPEDQARPHDPPRHGDRRHAPPLAGASGRGEAPRRRRLRRQRLRFLPPRRQRVRARPLQPRVPP